MTRGYAEPDPREDLSGMDAARKGLILGRLLGYRGGPPSPVDLVPAAMKPLPLAEFMQRLPELDESWRARVAGEAARGRVLRYVVSATSRRITAKLVAGAGGQPDGRRLGHAQHHHVRVGPLPRRAAGRERSGAGAAVTAAGILNDIHALAAD